MREDAATDSPLVVKASAAFEAFRHNTKQQARALETQTTHVNSTNFLQRFFFD